MCSNARLAVEAQISTNKMQAWEIELRRLELRIDAAVKRQKSHDEIELLRDEYDAFLSKPAAN